VAALPEASEADAALSARLSPPRAAHCRRVAATAVRLAGLHGLPAGAAELAGLLHDWCREMPEPELLAAARDLGLLAGLRPAQVVPAVLHGPVAARLLPQRWPDLPPTVLQAIDRHTTGDPEMTALDCLIYVADLIEPGHAFDGLASLRALAETDLAAAALAAAEAGLTRLLQRGRPIDLRTVAARNALLLRTAGRERR